MRVTPSNSKSNWSDVLNAFLFPYLFKPIIKRHCRTQTLWKIKNISLGPGCLLTWRLHSPQFLATSGNTHIQNWGTFPHVRTQGNEDSNQFKIILQGTNISHQTGRGKSSVQQWYVSAQEGRCFWPPFLGGWTHTKLPFCSFEIGQKNVWPIPRYPSSPVHMSQMGMTNKNIDPEFTQLKKKNGRVSALFWLTLPDSRKVPKKWSCFCSLWSVFWTCFLKIQYSSHSFLL